MSKHQTNAINTSGTSKQVREPTDLELTADELEHVWGGGTKGTGTPKLKEFIKVTMSDIIISNYWKYTDQYVFRSPPAKHWFNGGWCLLMEKIMNKSSKDASRLGHSTFEDRTLDALDDAELTAVTGGNSLSFGKLEFKYVQQHAD